MIRNILSVIAGLIIGFIVISGVEVISGKIYPLPAELNPYDRAALKEYMQHIAGGAVALLIAGYALGSFFGAYTASRISKKMRQGMITGIILLLGDIANIIMLPQPVWISVLTLVVFLPAAWAGAKLAVK